MKFQYKKSIYRNITSFLFLGSSLCSRKYSRFGRVLKRTSDTPYFLPSRSPFICRRQRSNSMPTTSSVGRGFKLHQQKEKTNHKGWFFFLVAGVGFEGPSRKYSRFGRVLKRTSETPYFLPCRAPSSSHCEQSHSKPPTSSVGRGFKSPYS